MNPENLWREDVKFVLNEKLKDVLQKYDFQISSGVKILKDISLVYTKKRGYKFQLNFFDQDIVIHPKNPLPLSNDLVHDSKRNYIEFRHTKNKSSLILPFIIIELKYSGVVTHSVITYSQISHDIKSIFPMCKYYMLIRYTDHTMNTLKRHGRFMDDIIKLQGKSNKKDYTSLEFQNDLQTNTETNTKFNNFIVQLKEYLKEVGNSLSIEEDNDKEDLNSDEAAL